MEGVIGTRTSLVVIRLSIFYINILGGFDERVTNYTRY